jgi:hypothetical protein
MKPDVPSSVSLKGMRLWCYHRGMKPFDKALRHFMSAFKPRGDNAPSNLKTGYRSGSNDMVSICELS